MLTKIRNNKIISAIAAFFDKKYFPFIVGAVIAALHITGQNEVGFIFIGLLLAFINLFSPNIRPAVPVAFTAVLVVSTRADYMQSAVEYFTRPLVIAVIVVAIGFVIVSALLRLYFDKTVLNCFRKRRLTYGFAAFSAVLLLGGLGTPYFAADSWGLAITVIFTGLVLYLFFSGTLERRDDDLEYLAYCSTAAAAVIVVELAALYARVYVPGEALGVWFKNKLFIGWGISNPIGELLSFLLAPVFLLVYQKKHGWLYYIFAVVVLIAVYFSLSRNALIFGTAVFVSMTALCVIGSKNRVGVASIAGACLIALILLFVLGKDTEAIKNLFAFITKMGMNDNGRFGLWKRFFGFFLEYPLFGAGFAACGTINEASMRMAHNTIFQILGSCGIVGIAAHVYHRVQTVLIFTKKPNISRSIIGVALLAYIMMGLFDPIYMFANFTIYYTIMLVFAEKDLERSLELTAGADEVQNEKTVEKTDEKSL